MDRWNLLERYGLSIDLAVEAHALLRGATTEEVPGVREDKEELDFATVTTITVLNATGERAMRRPVGTYVTIEAPTLGQPVPEARKQLVELLAAKITDLMGRAGLLPQADVLIVGLGNRRATPDSLGPSVVDRCLVTRHLHRYAPRSIPPAWRSVSGLAPGVLGVTGIETLEVVKGAVAHVHPGLIIAVDALAAQEVRRLGTTIQLCDTGVNPGSGTGKAREGLNRYTLGRPVIAIGLPTVVRAPVLAHDLFARLTASDGPERDQNLQRALDDLLSPFGGDLTVTPKEIDNLIDQVSAIIASGINRALFPDLSEEEVAYLV
ncbi:MAG: GPR endopeptidase [Clostridia bacterium]|jgi:spore protease|nr:GPR endopeptidase [Clostridia bacterium]MDH7573903.1 GPR endopeptidase [Clostridia bacterium]